MPESLTAEATSLGSVAGTIEHITTLGRVLWQLLILQESESSNSEKKSPYRKASYSEMIRTHGKLLPPGRSVEGLDPILERMQELKICWRSGDTITYRPSVLNSIALARQLLHDARPDPDLRYLIWRDVRRYYRFVQGAQTAHYMHEFAATFNRQIAERLQGQAIKTEASGGLSWNITSELLPLLKAKVSNDFGIPIRITDFFLECCRLLNYIQVSSKAGHVEIRTREVDAEYMLCQLYGVPTSITGFDDLFGGGGLMLVESPEDLNSPGIRGRAVLTVGPFGSGKSLLALQMAVEVARKGGIAWVMPMEQSREECLYSLESMGCLPEGAPIRVAQSVPDALDLLENPEEGKGALILVRTIKDSFEDFAIAFEENAQLMGKYSLRLLIVDPVSAVARPAAGADPRSSMLRLFDAVKQSGTNIWLVQEENGGEFLFEQNIADTVIHLQQRFEFGYTQRYMEIKKSRLQREQRGLHPFSIAPARGITVFPSSAAVRSRLQKRTVRVPDTAIRLGVPAIDEAIGEGNLFAGDVIVLKGRSGSGKSSVAIAFLLSSDLYRPKESMDSALLLTNIESESTARHRIEMVYERLRKKASFARTAPSIGILGMPGGFVKPGYILHRVEDYFERARMRRDAVVRVAVDNIVNMGFASPFINDDVTFGDTLVDLMRKHRVTSMFVCRDQPEETMTALQRSVVNSADCLIEFSTDGSAANFEVKKTRGMRHRRGLVALDLDPEFTRSDA